MEKQQIDARALGMVVVLALVGLAVTWFVRSRWTDHDVSDPGVTL
jgi:hypothetical protein